ncbi:MAG: transglycosylase SLT domain-containing protein, partial [Chloroflexi bacterium]|nr:transglycosylase SLT domain-containing protein [Chloroflexota bacterium]
MAQCQTKARRSQRWAVLVSLGLLVLALLGMAWACKAAAPTTSAEHTATAPSPSPTPSPADAALAAEFARLGKIDEAIGAYRAVIAQGDAEERQNARLALAQVYLDDGQVAEAVSQLIAHLLRAPAGADRRAAQYLLAEALALLDNWESALSLYDAYVEAGGGAAVYARLGRVEALLHLDRSAEAAREAESLLDETLPMSVRLPLVLRMAQALEASRPAEALVWYDRLLTESSSPSDQALALWRSALIQRDMGNSGPWIEAWPTIIQRYPATATAQAIVDEPPVLKIIGFLVDPYYTGLVYYRAGRRDEARQQFEATLEPNLFTSDRSLAARASYYLASLDERAGDTGLALTGYGRVLELDPRIELADDALWWRGQLFEQAGRIAEAEASYQRLADEFAGSRWAPDARLQIAFFDYDDASFAAAAGSFADIAERSQGGERRRALLWQGKALAAAGDEDAAHAAWRTLQQEAPNDYYGLRAAVLLGDARGTLQDAGLDEATAPDWAEIEAWLADSTGDDPWAALEALLYSRHWGLGQELLALGMSRRAGGEFRLLLENAGSSPAVLYQLTRFFHSLGLDNLSARAATRLLRAVPSEDAGDAPADLWRLAYPAPFLPVLREAADETGTPDVLLLALVRQESFFDPLAGSTAGALGLTQVIAPTGEDIARDLAVADFELEDLYRPALSLHFGAHYLRQQLDSFDDT